MWLFYSHALPVGSRMRGKDVNTSCPRCNHHTEDIEHMAFDCEWAADVRFLVF